MSESRAYLVRFAEIGRDGQPGRQGVRNDLAQEIERQLPGASVTALARGRLLVECAEDASPVLGSLPGVTSFSPCHRVALTDVARAAAALAARALPHGGSFAVRVRRVGDDGPPGVPTEEEGAPSAESPQRRPRHLASEEEVSAGPQRHPASEEEMSAEPSQAPLPGPPSEEPRVSHSRELVDEVARAVSDVVPGARVDLTAPELVLGIEVRGRDCHLFREVVPGIDRRGHMPWPGPGEPRFLADQMLGRLAVWLRLFGFDTAGDPDQPDSWLLRRARDEGRVLLTQDGPLSRAASAATYYVRAHDLDGQLAEVIRAFDLRFDRRRLLSRCTRCNHPIEKVAPDTVKGRVPSGVHARQRDFFRCPSCDQIYWEGDHSARILARLATHFPLARR